jgi:hypothetical protein
MAAVAHNPAFAKKVGIPQSVGMEFNKADASKNMTLTSPGGLVQHGGYMGKKHG